MTVSHETMAHGDCAKRRYRSPFRQKQRERTRAALLEAALSFVRRGNFRPMAKEIADKAGAGHGSVNRHFGSVELLYRVIAREHAATVISASGYGLCAPDYEHRGLAWLIMVGQPREMS